MKKLKRLFWAVIVIATIAAVPQMASVTNKINSIDSSTNTPEVHETAGNTTGSMVIDYINVGQGDATLISVNGKNMLIDAGKNETEKELVKYIKDKGITKLDYVIGTHPHEDHSATRF